MHSYTYIYIQDMARRKTFPHCLFNSLVQFACVYACVCACVSVPVSMHVSMPVSLCLFCADQPSLVVKLYARCDG